MVNTFRLQEMIHLARYESGRGEKDIRISRYYRGDYIAIQMIKTFFLTTIADILVIGLLIASDSERFLNLIDEINLVQAFWGLLLVYVITLVVYLQITYLISAARYDRVRRSVREYSRKLEELSLFEERRKSSGGRKQTNA